MKAHWRGEKEAIEAIRWPRGGSSRHVPRRGAPSVRRTPARAKLRHGEIPQIEAEVAENEARLAQIQSDVIFLKEEVDDEDVAEVVGKDRHPGVAADGGRGREAGAHGGALTGARDRPG